MGLYSTSIKTHFQFDFVCADLFFNESIIIDVLWSKVKYFSQKMKKNNSNITIMFASIKDSENTLVTTYERLHKSQKLPVTM